jgi:hypothetical protein
MFCGGSMPHGTSALKYRRLLRSHTIVNRGKRHRENRADRESASGMLGEAAMRGIVGRAAPLF